MNKIIYGLKHPILAARFLKEYIRWNWHGRKIRSQKHIGEIYSICKVCPEMTDGSEEDEVLCTKCGCFIHRTRETMNKASWITTKCPLKEPKWGPFNRGLS